MSGNSNNSPLLKVAPLWSKTSVKGGWYLTGRFGGVKILVMENRDRQGDDDPSHILYFTEASDRRQGVQQAAQERGNGLAHPRPARGHRATAAGASRGIRRRSMPISTMRRSGRGEGGQAKSQHHAGSREAGIRAGDDA